MITIKELIRLQMDSILSQIDSLKKNYDIKFEIEDCPLYRKGEGHSYDECQILTGLGCHSWTCPFCGFNVG